MTDQITFGRLMNLDFRFVLRGGKMCQIVEEHKLSVPKKSGEGGREALFNNFLKVGALASLAPQFCHLCKFF